MILTVLDTINNYLESAMLNDPFSTTLIVVVIMITSSIIAYKAGATNVMILFFNLILLIIATIIGFVPIWVILGIVMVVLLYAIMIITDVPVIGGK